MLVTHVKTPSTRPHQASGSENIFPNIKRESSKTQKSLNVCPRAYHVNQRAWCIIVMPAKTMDIIGILGIQAGA